MLWGMASACHPPSPVKHHLTSHDLTVRVLRMEVLKQKTGTTRSVKCHYVENTIVTPAKAGVYQYPMAIRTG